MALTQPISTRDAEDQLSKRIHIDEFLDSPYLGMKEEYQYAHFVLDHFRKEAWRKMAHNAFMRQFQLFVTYKGERYRVTGASRMGDVWLAKDHKRETGYDLRVDLVLAEFTNWGPTP